jgi:uncharacterized protein YkwD
MTARLSSLRPLVALLALALGAAPGCDGGGAPPPTGTLGRPDPTRGPSTPEDIDGDGVPNGDDNCPSLANADQRDICDYPRNPPAATGDVVADGVARLNFYRAMLGLDPVVADPEQSRTCQVHLDYLQAYATDNGYPYYLAHEEDPASPHYSDEGNQAGIDSVLSYGQADVRAAVEGWLQTLYHRLPLIDPGLRTVGVAFERGYACMQYRPGTTSSVTADHPVLWPIADGAYTDPAFGGAESPCPTVDDPLNARECPGSGTIVTLGLHDARSISDVRGRLYRLDTGEEHPLFRIWHDGGASPHEQMGYVDNTIALVPEVGSTLVETDYEAEIHATVDGTPQTYRWRFGFGGELDQSTECDLWMQGSFASAIRVGSAAVHGRICTDPDFFVLSSSASTYRVQVRFDRRVGQLDVFVYDRAYNPILQSTEQDGSHLLNDVPAGSYVEIRGRDGQMGAYRMLVEGM